jgi:hypothetical protein
VRLRTRRVSITRVGIDCDHHPWRQHRISWLFNICRVRGSKSSRHPVAQDLLLPGRAWVVKMERPTGRTILTTQARSGLWVRAGEATCALHGIPERPGSGAEPRQTSFRPEAGPPGRATVRATTTRPVSTAWVAMTTRPVSRWIRDDCGAFRCGDLVAPVTSSSLVPQARSRSGHRAFARLRFGGCPGPRRERSGKARSPGSGRLRPP